MTVRAELAGYGDDTERYEQALDKGHKARETLVTQNMGLVYFCVNDILGKRKNQRKLNSLSREDLVQEGAIGLARAVDRWNPEIGGKFSTFAVYWIRALILRCIAERDDIMRVPEHASSAVRKMTRAALQLGIDIDGERILSASWKEAETAKKLAEEAGLTDKQLDLAMKVRDRRKVGYVAFESWMQNGKDFESDLSSNEEEQGLSTVDREGIKDSLSRYLRPREMEALSWRYGLVSSHGDRNIDDLSTARGRRGEAMTFQRDWNQSLRRRSFE